VHEGVNGDGGGDGDTVARGNPGAPGDVAVFEEGGVPHSVLRQDAASRCAGGVCTLQEPVPTAGDPDAVGGLDECIIRDKSDIHYDPPAENGLFQKGAKVQAHVDCTGTDDTGSSGASGSAASDSATSDGPASGSSASDTPASDSPTG